MKYSVIIPHKDAPELLQRMLDSIPKRDDLEVIVVDDNSDPDKVNFNRFPGLGQSNTQIIFTKEGKGAGCARNAGIEHATGDWLIFADADDYFHTNNFNSLLSTQIPYGYDVVIWEAKWLSDADQNSKVVESFDGSFVIRKDAPSAFVDHVAPWYKMISRSILDKNGIKFEETTHANDVVFSAHLSAVTARYLYTPSIIYYYDTTHSNLTKQKTRSAYGERYKAVVRASRYAAENLPCIVSIGEKLLDDNYIYFIYLTGYAVICLGWSKILPYYQETCTNMGYSILPFKTKIKLLLLKNK